MSKRILNHNIYTFAVTRLQFNYFQKLNKAFNQSKNRVLYKNLGTVSLSRIPLKEILKIVDSFIYEKKNSVKHKNKKYLFFMVYRHIKTIDAIWNYWRYCSAIKKKSIIYMIMWNGLKYKQLIMRLAAIEHGVHIFFMENGLIPGMTTIDHKGVNYQNSVPRSPDFFLENFRANDNKIRIKDKNKNKSKSKYIFIPFQVNTDSQIVKFSPWIKDMRMLTEVITSLSPYLPDEYSIVFKTHPKCPENYEDLINSFKGNRQISFKNNTETNILIKNADIVCTVNSTVGIESLIQHKKVITLGEAFYNIHGLVHYAIDKDELKKIFLQIEKLEVDHNLISCFLNYMVNDYQVPGDWENPDQNHFDQVAIKLNQLTSE